jgi:hypothetical protein
VDGRFVKLETLSDAQPLDPEDFALGGGGEDAAVALGAGHF